MGSWIARHRRHIIRSVWTAEAVKPLGAPTCPLMAYITWLGVIVILPRIHFLTIAIVTPQSPHLVFARHRKPQYTPTIQPPVDATHSLQTSCWLQLRGARGRSC
jgi:hypothetical protein